ncbi:MAG: thioredoxin family protein [Spirochaetaceae bacterium]|nr:thioredoxin family protein [Spirochaetaceae bacterium]
MEENEKEVEQVNEAAETVQTETANTADTGKKAKSKKPVILGAIGAVVIAACGGVGAFFGLDLNVPAAKEWVKDYEAVQTTAKERNKNILLAFTGTGWDGVSDGFEKDVMNDSEFIKKMGKKFELAQIDIPAGENEVSEEEMQKIFTYAMMFNLETTPSLILLSPEGISYGSVAYQQEMGLEAVIEAVENIENGYKAMAKLKSDIEKASGVKKVQLIDELYEKSSDEEKAKMTDYILEVPALDPENQSGLVGKYKLLAAYSEAGLYMQRGDVVGARDVLLRMVEGSDVEPEYAQEAYYTAAYISALGGLLTTQEEIDFTCSLLEKAIAVYPESEHIEDLNNFLNLVKQQSPQSVELDEQPAAGASGK